MKPQSLIELVKGHKTYIQTHNFPDPDALASALGLQAFLRLHGIDTTLCFDGKIDKLSTRRMIHTFEIQILSKEETHQMCETDYIIAVDAQKYNSNITDFVGSEVACIDHHPTFTDCEYAYKDIRITGACSSIIASYYYDTDTKMDSNIAAALLYGIKMDTSDFSRGVTDLDIDMFGYLYKQADKEKFNAMLKNVMEYEDLKAYGAAIESVQVFDRIGFASIPFDCPDALIATISDFVLSLDIVDIAVVHAIREDGIKLSVRSEVSHVNAGCLVASAIEGVGKGGGHSSMAGGYISKENKKLLGEDIEYGIRQLFLDTIDQMEKKRNRKKEKIDKKEEL